MNSKYLHMAAFLLVIVGGLNWLLLGLFDWEIGMLLGGMSSLASKAVYVIVGLSAVYLIITHKSDCRVCSTPQMM